MAAKKKPAAKKAPTPVAAGAVPAEELAGDFPAIDLPVRPPFPPMEAKAGGRFRHGTRFLRWRPEKDPRACTFEQVRPKVRSGALERLGVAG